jgi:hypothetical protein
MTVPADCHPERTEAICIFLVARRLLMLQKAYILLLTLLLAAPLFAKERTVADAQKLAQHVLSHAIVIDTHADTPQMMLDDAYDLANPDSPFMISIPKMQKGHLGGEFFSIWVSVDWPPQDSRPPRP